jgi:hypothetical protein
MHDKVYERMRLIGSKEADTSVRKYTSLRWADLSS